MPRLLRTLLLALSTALALTPAWAEPPSVKAFFKRPEVRDPKLSPSGRYLAIQSAGKTDRMLLAVIDLQTMETPKVVAGFKNADIFRHYWVNEDRLVFEISDSPDGEQRVDNPGLWAVDRDGGNFRQLIQSNQLVIYESTNIKDRRLDANYRLFRTLPDGSSDVLVQRLRWLDDPQDMGVQLFRMDTRTGLTKGLSQGTPPSIHRWVTDWRGEPRSVEATVQGRVEDLPTRRR